MFQNIITYQQLKKQFKDKIHFTNCEQKLQNTYNLKSWCTLQSICLTITLNRAFNTIKIKKYIFCFEFLLSENYN